MKKFMKRKKQRKKQKKKNPKGIKNEREKKDSSAFALCSPKPGQPVKLGIRVMKV
jgi:hypothetical protein